MTSRNKQRGQALIESALVMLVFLPVLLGILDCGQFLYFHQSLTERARAAARWASVHTFDATKIANVAIYNDPDPPNGARPLLPNLNSTAGTNGYVSATLTDAGTEEQRVRVTIADYPFSFVIVSQGVKTRTITHTEPYEVGY